jgi:hypothetical protein
MRWNTRATPSSTNGPTSTSASTVAEEPRPPTDAIRVKEQPVRRRRAGQFQGTADAALLTAQLFLRAQLSQTLQPLGAEFYVLVLAGLLTSIAVIASTLPLLARTTGPEAARND